MKIHRILCLSATIVISQLALAALPPSSALGQVEGTLDFCAQVDPQSAAKYAEHKKHLVQDVPEKDVAEARKTADVQRGLRRDRRRPRQGPERPSSQSLHHIGRIEVVDRPQACLWCH